MKLITRFQFPAARVAAILTLVATTANFGLAQGQYVPPNFSQLAGSQSASAPPMVGALLAGGPAAAQGGQFMDVQGNSIQMANYCQNCPSGYGGPGPGCPSAGGPGDPMAVDFGGYGQDQCGPHYFDISVGAVFLQAEELFDGLQPFTSAGIASPDFFLDPANDFNEYEAGWEIAGRYDIGALTVLEVAYMGLYDIGYSDQVISADVAPGGSASSLVSIFNAYGTLAPIEGIDQGLNHAIDYKADLQSTEISLRRYWLANNPRISGTWLLGARYLRYTDKFSFDSTGLVNNIAQTANLEWSGENDMVGAQFGGDGWISLRQGLRLGLEGTAGIYNNRYKFSNSGAFSATTGPADFANAAEGNQVAFAGESEVTLVADILPSLSLRAGYRVLFLNSLATAANNIDQSGIGTGLVSTQAGLLFHGFQGGLEYVW